MDVAEAMRFVFAAAQIEARVTFTRSGYPILHVGSVGPSNPDNGGNLRFSGGGEGPDVVGCRHAK